MAALRARGNAALLRPGLRLVQLRLRLRVLVLAPVLLVLLRRRLLLALLRRPAGGGAACLVGLQAQAAHLGLCMRTTDAT